MSIGPWNKCGYIFFLSLKVTFSLNKFLCSYVTFSLTIDTTYWKLKFTYSSLYLLTAL